MLNRLASFFVRIVERWMPDPFLFCLLLTLLTYVLALGLTPASPLELTTQWYDGLWKILPFAMQMILILLTGYTLASSRPVRQVLERIASAPRSQGSAIVVLTVVSALASLVNWGFALVASALLAKEMGRRVPGCDFGFLVAGAYSGFVIWASGASSSIALVSATAGSEMNLIARYTGVETVALSQTLLAPMNLVLVAGTFLTLPLMFRLMMPRGAQIRRLDPALLAEAETATDDTIASGRTPAQRLERSRLLLYLLVLLGGVFLASHFYRRGLELNLNVVILIFLVVGMALHVRPASYVRAFNQAARVVGPLALQYPLYGGIMGMMQDSGLAGVISHWFVSVSSQLTFPFFCFVSSILITLFIPSGGGHWVVQGPFVIPAAVTLGVSPAVTAMAVAFGEQTGNMVQPFWALPILAIAGLSIRDIMGYCVMTFLLSAALTTLVLFLLA
ncbi:MAG TPA: TIGR00366 family protein [Candidatus Acidoferrales bacterium]|nr:TIGR00366 family protein [Candidatus Acidoferrales bacterium]